MVLYIGIYIESDWLYHAEWVALSNGQSGSELAEYSSAPDHATIARFRSIHFSQVAEKYLSLTVNYLMELGEIGGNEIFIDGTKIEANANKYTFVWKKSVTKNQARLLDKIALLVQECVKTYGLKEIWHGEVKEKHLGKILKKLYRQYEVTSHL